MKIKTDYDLRIIAPGLEFTEEQRSSIHVIGSSRQGKSYFIEWLMREDIDRGIGCCLLDPSAGGSSAYRLLAYCCEQGIENVLFIDVEDSYDPHEKIVNLNPFQYKDGKPFPKLRQHSVDTLMRAVRDLYGVTDPTSQSIIERYLPSVFQALYDSHSPLVDAKYFSNRLYKPRQDEILFHTDLDTQLEIKEAMGSLTAFKEFQSTVRRLLRFTKGRIGKMFTADTGVDWMEAVRDDWVVIVRLDNLDKLDARLLGTYIIAQLTQAKERLNAAIDRNRDFKKRGEYPPFYLYADEAYMFASESLKNILDQKQKTNFKITLAHHYAKQFTPEFYESLKVNAGITAQFYIKGRKTRDDMSEEMYGGDIEPKDASYANSNLAKQQAVIQIGKGSPTRTRIPNVPTPDIPTEELINYKIDLYQRLTEMGWYHDADKIDQPNYEPTRSYTNNTRSRAEDDRPTTKQNTRPRRAPSPQKWTVLPEDLPGRKQPPKGDDKAQPKASKSKSKG